MTLVDRVESVVITYERKQRIIASIRNKQLILLVELCNIREAVKYRDVLTNCLLNKYLHCSAVQSLCLLKLYVMSQV